MAQEPFGKPGLGRVFNWLSHVHCITIEDHHSIAQGIGIFFGFTPVSLKTLLDCGGVALQEQ